MKIALAQLNYHIGNFEANEAKIIAEIQRASLLGADLIVFSELALSGYPPRDFLAFDDFIQHCEASLKRIANSCQNITAIVGSPGYSSAEKGKKLVNAAYVLADGQIKDQYVKQLLPTYDVFDEYRYFEPGRSSNCIEIHGEKIALTICEDLWNIEGSYLYNRTPLQDMMAEKPAFIINIAASPFSADQESHRKKVFDYQLKKSGIPLIYVNHVGAQTELIFDGNSCILDAKGQYLEKLASFEEDFRLIDTDNWPQVKEQKEPSRLEKIEKALVLGIRDYFRKLNFKTATLGLSGGIDSALTLVLAVKALGAEQVVPILMPSQFSSQHSVDDSLELCKTLGCVSHQIPISSIYQSFESELSPLFEGMPFDLTEENIQSRIRGTLLMAYTNKFGAILLNTSNKSELAVGYGTLYGDMAGGISVLGDLYKTEVFELSEFINRMGEVIPKNILTKAPSAELRPNQKDSDSLPDYAILDKILKLYIEGHQSPSNIIEQGHDAKLVTDTIRLVNINEYKRHQSPPILRVSDKAFGMGRRMPIVGKYLS